MSPEHQMDPTHEYAAQYTRKERVKFLLLALTLGGAIMLVWKAWALPHWVEFVEKSPCYQVFGISGTAVVFYALFVGLPLVSALLAVMLFSWRGVKILRDKQVPYSGEKVFRPTRIRRGSIAVIVGWVHVLTPVPFLAISLWGAAQAKVLTANFKADSFDYSKCDSLAIANQ
jgi:hypothetical protein